MPALMKPGNLIRQPAGIALAVAMAAGLASCADPDPKSECVRYRIETAELNGRWSAFPPVGMSPLEQSRYLDEFELRNPNYVADRKKIKEKYKRRLRTSNVSAFCNSFL